MESNPSKYANRRSRLIAHFCGSQRLIDVKEIRYLYAEDKCVIVHHARGEDLIYDSLKSLEKEFGNSFVRIHHNCLVASDELIELRRSGDGRIQAVLRHGDKPLEVSRRCAPQVRRRMKQLILEAHSDIDAGYAAAAIRAMGSDNAD